MFPVVDICAADTALSHKNVDRGACFRTGDRLFDDKIFVKKMLCWRSELAQRPAEVQQKVMDVPGLEGLVERSHYVWRFHFLKDYFRNY